MPEYEVQIHVDVSAYAHSVVWVSAAREFVPFATSSPEDEYRVLAAPGDAQTSSSSSLGKGRCTEEDSGSFDGASPRVPPGSGAGEPPALVAIFLTNKS